MVVSVYLVYQLSIEVCQLLEFLLKQASHALFLALVLFLLTFPTHAVLEVGVD